MDRPYKKTGRRAYCAGRLKPPKGDASKGVACDAVKTRRALPHGEHTQDRRRWLCWAMNVGRPEWASEIARIFGFSACLCRSCSCWSCGCTL